MSKEFKNTDDLFRTAFADESSEVPAFVKENIDKRLGFRQKKKGWFWFGGVTILVLITAGVLRTLTESGISGESGYTTNLSENGNQHDFSETLSAMDALQEVQKNTGQQAGTTQTNNIGTGENQTLTQTHSLLQTSADYVSETGVISSDNTPNESRSSSAEQSDQTNAPADNSLHQSDVSDSGNSSYKTENTQSGGIYETALFNTNSSAGLISRLQEQHPGDKNLASTGKPLSVSNPSQFSFQSNHPDANTIERGERYSPWMISGTAGVNFTQSKYTFNTPAEEEYYVNSTYTVPGFEGNLDVRYRLKNSLTFGTGAGISQLVENYSFFKQTQTIDTAITWTITPVYDSLDTTLIIDYDSTSTTNIDSSNVILYDANGTTQATYLQIPFSIGTQIIRNKFRFDLFVMGRFNYLISARGGYLQNDTFTLFTKNQNQIFKPWYLDLMLGTAIHYEFYNNIYLTGTFRFHPALGNLYENLSFNRKLQSFHLGVGISWKL